MKLYEVKSYILQYKCLKYYKYWRENAKVDCEDSQIKIKKVIGSDGVPVDVWKALRYYFYYLLVGCWQSYFIKYWLKIPDAWTKNVWY